MGLHHEALQTIYKGTILTLLLYGDIIWAEAVRFEYNRLKYISVQSLMNFKITKTFGTTSTEALSMPAGTASIIIRMEESVKPYFIRKGKGTLTQSMDLEV